MDFLQNQICSLRRLGGKTSQKELYLDFGQIITFAERGAFDLADPDGEAPGEGGAAGHHGQRHRVVGRQAHVDVH